MRVRRSRSVWTVGGRLVRKTHITLDNHIWSQTAIYGRYLCVRTTPRNIHGPYTFNARPFCGLLRKSIFTFYTCLSRRVYTRFARVQF